MTNKPLQVYLDSSDFSVLSDTKNRTEKHDDIEQRLMSWQAAGAIQLRFSYAHVVEAAPTTATSLEVARDRFRCIQRLCGKACLADPYALFEAEIRLLGELELAENDLRVYRDGGDWTPSIDSSEIGPPSTTTRFREEFDSMGLARAPRRKLERELFDQNGGLRLAARPRLRAMSPSFIEQASHQYPLTQKALRDLSDYSLGIGSREKATQGIMDSLNDLESFGEWYARDWERVTPLSQTLRQDGERLRESMLKLAEDVRQICEHHNRDGQSTELVATELQKAFQTVLRDRPTAFIRKLAAEQGFDLPQTIENVWRAASLMTVAHLTCHVGRLSALIPKGVRKPKTSDFGDILHAAYLPHVDIFRADGFMANAIADAKLPCNATIVGKLTDLPMAIERRLEDGT